MKYYSEKTKKLYESQEDLVKAEKNLEEQVQAEKVKAEQKDTRWKEVEEARNYYLKLYKAYVKDYNEDCNWLHSFFWN